MYLGGFVEFTEEIVEHIDEITDRQCHRQRREVDNVSVEDAHVIVFLQIQFAK